MDQHRKLLVDVLENGTWSQHARTGVRTRHVFSRKLSYDLSKGIPLITTRAVPWKNSIKEHLWMISGSTDNTVLLDQKVPVWRLWDIRETDLDIWGKSEDARGNPIKVGSCGPIYGEMWRHWPSAIDKSGVDQLQYVIDTLKSNPTSRRIIVSAWNPDVLPVEDKSPQENVLLGRQCLAPCHTLFQLSTTELDLYDRLSAAVYWWTPDHAIEQMDVAKMMAFIRFHDSTRLKLRSAYPGWLGRRVLKYKQGYVPRPTDESWLKPSYVRSMHRVLDTMGLPRHRVDMQLYARSQDLPLGTVFNQFAYASFLQMIAAQVGMFPGFYHHTMGDVHIYENQIPGVIEQIKRKPRPFPRLELSHKPNSIFDYKIEDFSVVGYDPHPKIAFPLTK